VTPSLRSRLPSIFIILIGGIAAALLLSAFENRLVQFLALVFYLPLILRAAQDIGIFSQAVVLEEIGGKDLRWREILRMAWSELRVVLLLSIALGVAGGLIATIWENYSRFGLAVGLTLFITVLVGTAVGILLPFITRRIRGELRYTQARFSSLLIGLATLAIYLGMATVLL
jgi:magnesium transporter